MCRGPRTHAEQQCLEHLILSCLHVFVTDIDGNGCRQWRWKAVAMEREGKDKGEEEEEEERPSVT